MNHPVNWQLLAKYLSGECNSNEKYTIESRINVDPDKQQLVEFLKIAWNTAEPGIQTSDTMTLWQQLSKRAGIETDSPGHTKIPLSESPAWTKWQSFTVQLSHKAVWRYAAVLLIFLLSALYIFSGDLTSLLGIKGNTELKTILVRNARRDSITLSDGSKITLDAGSKISFPGKFTGKAREVYLTGEAFFEVAPNPGKPFTVFINQAAVEVVGTKFNIRAWQQERKITITVTEGKVLLYSEKDGIEKSVTLNQGYASTVPENGQPTLPRMVDVRKSTGWMQNEIYFENTPLSEILNQLERWYDVKFEVRDSTVINDCLTVHLSDRTLEYHLKLIGELVDAHFAHVGKLYRLMPM